MKNFSNTLRGSTILALLATLILSWPFLGERPQTSANACWTNQLIECFDLQATQWPWSRPTGAWRVNPPISQLTWGIQDRIYSVGLESYCGDDDDQACWCLGGPRTEDPDFDLYPANLNTYVTYGPLNTTTSQYGSVRFVLYLENALDIGDSIFWGADSVFSLGTSPTHVWVDSSIKMETSNGWVIIDMNLADLNRMNGAGFDGDSVSALGRPAVYIFWWFKANSNTQRGVGSFIDDVIIALDDGALDCRGGSIQTRNLDSVSMPENIVVGDSILAMYTWNVCDGGAPMYPPFHVQFLVDDEVVSDSVVSDILPGVSQSWWSPPLVFETEGTHVLTVNVDPLNEVAEGNENNNVANLNISVLAFNDPPVFTWLSPGPLAPGGDTLFAYGEGLLRWECYDPDDDASISIYYDTDNQGCTGPFVPGGNTLVEHDGVDSLLWTVTSFVPGSIRWPYAIVQDGQNFLCQYADFPMQAMSTGTGEDVFVPVTFHLNQNYPESLQPVNRHPVRHHKARRNHAERCSICWGAKSGR
jgi:hypothetical protein